MSEEEKKAIEHLENTSLDPLEYKADMNAIEIVLNLIEKQQKEIEKLKEKNASLRKEIKLMKSINIDDNYISREEIKNVLDEHFRFYKELRKQDNYPNEAIINGDCLSRLSMLQTLYLELLEE